MNTITVSPNKVCPVVLRQGTRGTEVLAFEHPKAGYQLVKGSLEPNESIESAALRELAEESGIVLASVVRHLGIWQAGIDAQVWAFLECRVEAPLPDCWVHDAPDDGGHRFHFFWQPLTAQPSSDAWHPLFQHALAYLRHHYATGGHTGNENA